VWQAIQNAQWNVLPTLLGNETFSFTFNQDGYGNIGFDILNYRGSGTGSGYVYNKVGTG
jgi:hypothetical protein